MEINKNKVICISFIIILIIGLILYYFLKSKDEYIEISNDIDYSSLENKEETKNKIKVHIAGFVENEGVFELDEGARVQDAIDAAGGILADAYLRNINLALKLEDGQKVYIPNKLEAEEEEEFDNIERNVVNKKININTANQTELETLNGIGPSIALSIIEYRKQNGKFKSIEELKNISGIGEAKYNLIENNITI